MFHCAISNGYSGWNSPRNSLAIGASNSLVAILRTFRPDTCAHSYMWPVESAYRKFSGSTSRASVAEPVKSPSTAHTLMGMVYPSIPAMQMRFSNSAPLSQPGIACVPFPLIVDTSSGQKAVTAP